jgi:hypothetical protein
MCFKIKRFSKFRIQSRQHCVVPNMLGLLSAMVIFGLVQITVTAIIVILWKKRSVSPVLGKTYAS